MMESLIRENSRVSQTEVNPGFTAAEADCRIPRDVFGLINNVLNQHYYLGGTCLQTGGLQSADPTTPNLLPSVP
jgi:hypothetical protein